MLLLLIIFYWDEYYKTSIEEFYKKEFDKETLKTSTNKFNFFIHDSSFERLTSTSSPGGAISCISQQSATKLLIE